MKRVFKSLTFILLLFSLTFGFAPNISASAAVAQLNYKTKTIDVGKKFKLKVLNTSKKVKFSSNKPETASVSKKGVVKGLKKGIAIITAKVGKKQYNCKVTVQDNTSFKSGFTPAEPIGILEKTTDFSVEVPPLFIEGDKWTVSEEELQEAWKHYFPLMVTVLGPCAEDFYTDGVTWILSDETLAVGCNEWDDETNTVTLGMPTGYDDMDDIMPQLVHETSHMWMQRNNEPVGFAIGQWINEAHAGLAFDIIHVDMLDLTGHSINIQWTMDLMDNYGFEAVNGQMGDGDKYSRLDSDTSAGMSLFCMDTILSTEGTYDYWPKVAKLMYQEENQHIPLERAKEIIDEAAGGKTIDGMKPSEWLFSRSCSNTNGKDGVFVNCLFANETMDDPNIDQGNRSTFGRDTRIDASAYIRENGVEKGYAGSDTKVEIFDYTGKKIYTQTEKLDEWGHDEGIETSGRHRFNNSGLNIDDLPAYSVIRCKTSMKANGKTYSDIGYTLKLPGDPDHLDYITLSDDRMFFILTDEKENIITDLKESDIKVSGAISVDKSHINVGTLIVTVKQGDTVTVKTPAKTYKFTKPVFPRVIPIIAK